MIRLLQILLFATLIWAAPLATAQSLNSGSQRPKAPPAGPQGPELVQRLAAMSPEEREKALAAFPPARRRNLEQRIEDFQKLPPAQQRAMRERVEKLSRLSPERQAEVRASLREFNQLPQDRRVAIRREVRRTTGMPEDSRQAYMNSNGFLSRFSAPERKIIDDLRELSPEDPPGVPARP